MQRRIQLKDISGVAAGRTALINCPIGPRYHSITLILGDTAAGNGNSPTPATVAGEIRLNYFNGIQRRALASQVDVINSAMGSVFASQQAVSGGANGTGRRALTIFLNEPWRKRDEIADALAWQTGFFGKGDRFLVEVDIAAAITPLLTAFAVVDDFNGGRPHPIVKWDKNDAPAVGTPIEFSKLDRKDAYVMASLFDTSDGKTIDRVRIVQGATEIYDLAKSENSSLLSNWDMNPAAGAYHAVFDLDDSMRNIVMASGLQLTATPSAAANGTLPIIGQRLGLPE